MKRRFFVSVLKIQGKRRGMRKKQKKSQKSLTAGAERCITRSRRCGTERLTEPSEAGKAERGGAKKFFEKRRKRLLTAKGSRDKFSLLRRGEKLSGALRKNFRKLKKVVDKPNRAG